MEGRPDISNQLLSGGNAEYLSKLHEFIADSDWKMYYGEGTKTLDFIIRNVAISSFREGWLAAGGSSPDVIHHANLAGGPPRPEKP